jgi:hypothetical protein
VFWIPRIKRRLSLKPKNKSRPWRFVLKSCQLQRPSHEPFWRGRQCERRWRWKLKSSLEARSSTPAGSQRTSVCLTSKADMSGLVTRGQGDVGACKPPRSDISHLVSAVDERKTCCVSRPSPATIPRRSRRKAPICLEMPTPIIGSAATWGSWGCGLWMQDGGRLCLVVTGGGIGTSPV